MVFWLLETGYAELVAVSRLLINDQEKRKKRLNNLRRYFLDSSHARIYAHRKNPKNYTGSEIAKILTSLGCRLKPQSSQRFSGIFASSGRTPTEKRPQIGANSYSFRLSQSHLWRVQFVTGTNCVVIIKMLSVNSSTMMWLNIPT